MDETLTDEIAVRASEWAQKFLQDAAGEGVGVLPAVFVIAAIPLLMQGISLLRPMVQVWAEDRRETIRLEKMRQLVEMRKAEGAEVFSDALSAMDAGITVAPPPAPTKR